MIDDLKKDLLVLKNPKRAKLSQGFFKTGKGEYGEGDIFLGITVLKQREVAQKYKDLDIKDVENLLKSKTHEERLVSLLILVEQYKKGDEEKKRQIYNFYLKNAKKVNNWDLVDLSAHKILGEYLFKRDKNILLKLAKSKNLWERRIAIISTAYFIKQKQHQWTFKIAEILINDKHDLIQKAVGWMLREVGKNVSFEAEEEFLKKHYKKMPRTMLRYAIERFDEKLRKFYLTKIH